MKKNFLSLALIAMSLVSFNGMAQSQDNNVADPTCKEKVCTKDGKPCKDGKKDRDGKRGKKDKSDKFSKASRKGDKMNPFEGITLTEAQKAQLEQLKAKRQAARIENKKMAKAEKQKRDSVSFQARKAAKKEYLEEIKAIIGPDQYVVFLENMVINGNNVQKAAKMQKGLKDGSRRSDKQMKGDRAHKQFKRSASPTSASNS